MIIKCVRIGHFGKFHNKEISFSDGLNLVQGANESGKTTLFAFIGAMLFGFDRNRGRAGKADSYSRYKPWDTPGAYQGSMDFEHDGHSYRLSRIFYRKEESCKLTDLATGRPVELAGDTITSLIPGLTASAFYNTMAMGQKALSCTSQFGDEVHNHIANLATAKSSRVDVTSALENLEKRKKELEKGIKASDTSQAQIKHEELLEMEKHMDELLFEKKNSEKKLDDIREKLIKEQSQKPDSAAAMENLKVCREALDKDLEALRNRENEVKKLREQKDGMSNNQNPAGQDKLPQSQDSRGKASGSKGYAGLLILAVGAILAIIGNGRYKLFVGAGVILMLVGAVVCLMAVIGAKEKKLAGKASELSKGDESSGDVGASLNTELRTLEERYDASRKRLEEAELELNRVLSAAGDAGMREAKLKDELSAAENAIEKAEWQLESFGELSAEIEECERYIAEAETNNINLSAELEAVELAISAISELSVNIKEDFSAGFNELLSEEICLVTDGKYSGGRVTDDYTVEVLCGDDYIPADRLSAGTVDQLNIALRFASERLLLEGLNIPVLMDESFAYTDDERLRSALSAIAERDGRQTILLTCSDRELRLLKELQKDCSVIYL